MAKKGTSDSKILAFIGVLLPIIGFILVYIIKKEDKYAMFYAKQGLVLGLAAIIISIVTTVLKFIPPAQWLANTVLWIAWTIMWIVGMIYSLYEEKKDLPVVGDIAKKF